MNWIKMSDRLPSDADLPVFLHGPNTLYPGLLSFPFQRDEMLPAFHAWTHWMPATLPAPPPKEKTQKELDGEACHDFLFKHSEGRPVLDNLAHPVTAWHAALKWEREQVGAMLSKPLDENQERWGVLNMDDFNALRKRCGL